MNHVLIDVQKLIDFFSFLREEINCGWQQQRKFNFENPKNGDLFVYLNALLLMS